MPKYNFNFDLEAWISDVEIEADSFEEAERKLYSMTVEELIEDGFIEDSDLKNVEGVCVEDE